MVIKLISYRTDLDDDQRLSLTSSFLKNPGADLLVFSGKALGNEDDIQKLKRRISGSTANTIFDVPVHGKNQLWAVINGNIINLDSKQMFTNSSAIKGNLKLCNKFLAEMTTKRWLNICGKNVLIILCGENNIVVNRKEGTVDFRLDDDSMKARFENLISSADIIINPTHTRNSRPHLFYDRAKYFSNDAVYCFAAQNMNLNIDCIQYAFKYGKPIKLSKPVFDDDEDTRYVTRSFTI